MEDRPWLFDDIPSLHEDTLLHTARRSDAEAPAEYKFNLSTLVSFLENNFGMARVYGDTAYTSDAEAAADSVPVGGLYELSIDNIYGIPTGNGGVLKRRIE